MKVLILVFVIISALIAIASGIWVAISLGNAISPDQKEYIPDDANDNSELQ